MVPAAIFCTTLSLYSAENKAKKVENIYTNHPLSEAM